MKNKLLIAVLAAACGFTNAFVNTNAYSNDDIENFLTKDGISVIKATWGHEGGNITDVTELLKKQCDGHYTCTYTPTYQWLGGEGPGRRTLKVWANCPSNYEFWQLHGREGWVDMIQCKGTQLNMQK